jgi:hypothetical protein
MIEGREELIMRVRYACDMCESDFSRRNTLTKHKFKIHGIPTRKYTKKKMGKERQLKESSKRAMRLFKKFSLKNYDDEAIKDIISEGIGGDSFIDEVITDLTDVGKIDDIELKKEKGVLLDEQTYTTLSALTEEQRELLILEINHRVLSEEKSIRTSMIHSHLPSLIRSQRFVDHHRKGTWGICLPPHLQEVLRPHLQEVLRPHLQHVIVMKLVHLLETLFRIYSVVAENEVVVGNLFLSNCSFSSFVLSVNSALSSD